MKGKIHLTMQKNKMIRQQEKIAGKGRKERERERERDRERERERERKENLNIQKMRLF